jgi:uncharacterized membrane protein YgcG
MVMESRDGHKTKSINRPCLSASVAKTHSQIQTTFNSKHQQQQTLATANTSNSKHQSISIRLIKGPHTYPKAVTYPKKTIKMKHTAVLLSLIAVTTAAKLPNASPDIADVVARHEGHPEQNTTMPGDGHDEDLEKRRGGGAGAGGAGGGHSSGAGGSRGGSSGTTSYKSDASALMGLDVGLLVAGVAGAGVGAIFL